MKGKATIIATPAETDPHNEQAAPLVIVMHASVGSGHRSAANAVAQAFEYMKAEQAEGREQPTEAFPVVPKLPDGLEVEVLDVLDYGRVVFDGDKTASMFTGPTARYTT